MPYENFYKDKSSPTGHTYVCKNCIKERSRIYRENNLEKERSRKHNNPTVKAYSKKYYQENKNTIVSKRKQNSVVIQQYQKSYFKLWYIDNKDKVATNGRNRRARIQNAEGYATTEQVQARMAYYGYRCIYCGGPFEHVEHMIPLSRGGTNWPANLAPSCGDCNWSKNVKTIWEFVKLSHN